MQILLVQKIWNRLSEKGAETCGNVSKSTILVNFKKFGLIKAIIFPFLNSASINFIYLFSFLGLNIL